jgi:gamma-tubulin complex component 2
MKTTAIQRSIVSSSYRINYENDAADENLDGRVMSWSASKRQATSPIEQFRAAADQYDFEQKHRRQQETSFEQQGTKDQHQYQFRHLADDKAFESTTPETSKSHRPRNSFESPQQAKTGDIGQDRFQTPHNASPDQGRQLQSPAALDDQCLLKDNGVCTIDAASIHSSNNVVLRSCLTGTTVQVFQSEALASIQGLDLGLEQELLEVVKVQSEGSSHSDGLRYGDVVIFRSSIARGKALGTRKRRRDIRGVDELGFFDVGSIKSDRWVILPSRFDKKIVIGRASLSTKNSLQHTNDSNRGLVQSGAPIVLRNCYNGGVLSIREGKLTLLTDSYDSSTFADLEDSTLLGRLQHHDKLCPSISESFQLLLPCVPPCPSWSPANGIGERLFSSSTFLQQSERNQSMMETIQAVTNLSTQMKEKILIDEVVGSFLGLEGVHIRFSSDNGNGVKEQAFHLIDAGGIVFDLSLRRLVEQILSLSSSYERVKHFVASHYPGYEYGRVMHALCEGLDSYLDLFASFVSDLERKVRNRKGSLTMKSIHYEITPLLHSMSILENVTEALSETNGGKLINTLCSLEKRVYMGDTVAKDLIGTLLDRCSAPYLDMLTNWLQSGMLYDTYDEFMVFQPHLPKVQTHFDGDSWSSLFQLRESHVVKDVFRNEKTIQKIVVTGKYWNAIQACNVNVKSLQETNMALPKIKTLGFHSDSSTILSYVDTTYYCASKNLISLLKGKFKLMDSLQTMKRYFLLDQGDFFMHFLDITENELMKPFENVSLGRVQHSLSMSVQSTEAQRDGDIEASSHFLQEDDRQLDPNALRCRFQGESLVAYLDSLYGGIDDLEPKTPSRQAYGASNGGDTGFDLFTIDFAQIPFPTSLVLSGHAMDSYKLLFRQLFLSKHVERRLVGVWSDHQVLKKLDSLRGLLGPTFLLRQRMLHFVQNLNNYMTFEVVESNWLEMMSAINDPETSHEQTVDAILEVHDTFLGKTLDACLLTNPFLIKSLTKLLKTCLLFTDQMKRFMDTTKIVSAFRTGYA